MSGTRAQQQCLKPRVRRFRSPAEPEVSLPVPGQGRLLRAHCTSSATARLLIDIDAALAETG